MHARRRRIRTLAALALAAGATGAAAPVPGAAVSTGEPGSSAGETPSAVAAVTRTVTLRDIAFNPGRVTITRGDTIVWRWRDGGTRHDIASRSFRGASARSSGSIARTFRTAGTFRYRCTLHPGMNGAVVVRR